MEDLMIHKWYINHVYRLFYTEWCDGCWGYFLTFVGNVFSKLIPEDTCSSTSFVQLDKYEIWDSVFCFREIHGLKNNCAEFPKPWGLTVLWCYTRPSFEDFVGSDRMQMPSEWWNGSFPPSLAILREPNKRWQVGKPFITLPFLLNFCFFCWFFWFQMNWNSGDGIFCDI